MRHFLLLASFLSHPPSSVDTSQGAFDPVIIGVFPFHFLSAAVPWFPGLLHPLRGPLLRVCPMCDLFLLNEASMAVVDMTLKIEDVYLP